MIDVRELRIGNIFKTSDCDCFRVGEVYEKEDGLYCVENGIDFNGSSLYGSVEDLQPIPLTEELLVKCGMNECDDACVVRYSYRNGKFKMNINNIENGCQICSIEVKYLHQLQNIYFDLTGKELEVNL